MRKLERWIEAGAVVRPHGLRGEVVLDLKRDLHEHLGVGVEIRLTSGSGEVGLLQVERARMHQGRLIVKLKGVEERADAERLRAHVVWLTREQIGPLGEGRWFVQDILGMEVFTDAGERLGRITDVLHMPANDVYVVEGNGEEILLPVTEEVIRSVDIEAGRMLVHLLKGLRRGDL